MYTQDLEWSTLVSAAITRLLLTQHNYLASCITLGVEDLGYFGVSTTYREEYEKGTGSISLGTHVASCL